MSRKLSNLVFLRCMKSLKASFFQEEFKNWSILTSHFVTPHIFKVGIFILLKFWILKQGWGAGVWAGAGAVRSRVIFAPWSRSRLNKKLVAGAGAAWKKSQEPEPLKT